MKQSFVSTTINPLTGLPNTYEVDDRRNFLSIYLTGGAAAMMLAGCTQAQVTATEKQIADFINQVQAGVATTCAAVGKIVPTANSVLQVLLAIIGTSSVAGVTAAMIAQAVTDIAAIGCPQPGPAPTATAKGVNVVFY